MKKRTIMVVVLALSAVSTLFCGEELHDPLFRVCPGLGKQTGINIIDKYLEL